MSNPANVRPHPGPLPQERETGKLPVPSCCFLVMRTGADRQTECGDVATHVAAKNPRLFLCKMHAPDVGKRFRLRELTDGAHGVTRPTETKLVEKDGMKT